MKGTVPFIYEGDCPLHLEPDQEVQPHAIEPVVRVVHAAEFRVVRPIAVPHRVERDVVEQVVAHGQRVLAALEPVIAATAQRALKATLDDLGSAAFRADLASMRHETQYTRLFRS